jgi:hypothetical protein
MEMGRRQRRIEARPRSAGGLPNAYPCAPRYPSQHGFYVYLDSGSFAFHSFAATYAARHFLNTLISDREYKWKRIAINEHLKHDYIVIEGWGRIRGEHEDDLSEVLEHEMTDAEAAWEPDEPHVSYWRRLAHPGIALPKPKRDEETPALPRPERPKKEPREPRAPKPDGLASVGDIAAQMNMDPKHARDALRRSKTEKPAHGWAWPASEVDAIKRIIKENAK